MFVIKCERSIGQRVERCIDKVEICDSWANTVNDFDIQRTVHRDMVL